MYELSQQVLRTDISGMPLEWIGYQAAVRLLHLGQIAYACGPRLYRIHGGINYRTGRQSVADIEAIIATRGQNLAVEKRGKDYTPPLNNQALFKRDAHLCLYCGKQFMARELSRDHVTPLTYGGTEAWNNVVAACKRCNNHKADRTPEAAGMELLAIPFTPTHAEYVYLQGKRILADQMEFLLAHFPRSSPLHERLARASAIQAESADALRA